MILEVENRQIFTLKWFSRSLETRSWIKLGEEQAAKKIFFLKNSLIQWEIINDCSRYQFSPKKKKVMVLLWSPHLSENKGWQTFTDKLNLKLPFSPGTEPPILFISSYPSLVSLLLPYPKKWQPCFRGCRRYFHWEKEVREKKETSPYILEAAEFYWMTAIRGRVLILLNIAHGGLPPFLRSRSSQMVPCYGAGEWTNISFQAKIEPDFMCEIEPYDPYISVAFPQLPFLEEVFVVLIHWIVF